VGPPGPRLEVVRDHPIVPASGPVERRATHRITVRWRGGEAKLCQIQFGRDGFFIHFPYHPDSPGIAARCIAPPQLAGEQVNIDLAATGYVTSHKVKYSHHVDGNCHFSQDGRVVTKVRNLSRGLSGTVGHVFTIYAQGLSRFAERRQSDLASAFDLGDSDAPPVVRIVGRWVRTLIPQGVANPISLELPPGYLGPGLACCPPDGSPIGDSALILEGFIMPILDPNPEFLLSFTGGFGPEAHDHTVESSFLVLNYPATIDKPIPSMDFTTGARHD